MIAGLNGVVGGIGGMVAILAVAWLFLATAAWILQNGTRGGR
jgi:hypothetical protein